MSGTIGGGGNGGGDGGVGGGGDDGGGKGGGAGGGGDGGGGLGGGWGGAGGKGGGLGGRGGKGGCGYSTMVQRTRSHHSMPSGVGGRGGLSGGGGDGGCGSAGGSGGGGGMSIASLRQMQRTLWQPPSRVPPLSTQLTTPQLRYSVCVVAPPQMTVCSWLVPVIPRKLHPEPSSTSKKSLPKNMAARAHSSPVHTLRVDGEQLSGISHAPPCMSLSPTPMLVTLGGGAMPGGSGGGVGGGGTVQNWRSRALVVQPTWQQGVQRVQLHHPCPAGQVHALVSLLPVVLVSLEPFVPFMSVPSVTVISEAFVAFCAFPSSTPTHTMPAPSRSSVHKMQHATSQFLPHHHEQPHHTRSTRGSFFFSKWCFSGCFV